MSTLAVTNIKHESATDNAIVLSSNGSAEIRASSINSGPLAGFRNAIINGNFDIWQRGTSFSSPANGTYTADRWQINYNGSGATRTLSRQAFTLGQTDVPREPTYFFRYNQSVAGSGATTQSLAQRIEGVRTFAGQQVTLSFYAKAAAPINIAVVAEQYFGSGGSPSASVYTSVLGSTSIGTTWAKYTATITLPSISGKTLGSNNDDQLGIFFDLPINTTFTFDLAQVQLEAGPVATPFERRPIGTELILCQRYYILLESQLVYEGYVVGVVGVLNNIAIPVAMRGTPTASTTIVSASNASTFTVNGISSTTVRMQTLSDVTGSSFVVYNIRLSAEL